MVLRRQEEAVILGKDGVEKQLPPDEAPKFSVFERKQIALSIGDRIRFTKNVKRRGQKFFNNELRTVIGIRSRLDKYCGKTTIRAGGGSRCSYSH